MRRALLNQVQGYSSFENTWEPEHHLTPALRELYFKPRPSNDVIQDCIDLMRRHVMESLRGKAVLQRVSMEFRQNVYIVLFSGKGK